MPVTRRQFFSWAATAAVGVCVASHVPTSWLPAPVRRYAATEFLTRAWNDATRGCKASELPRDLYAGAELFDAFESEILRMRQRGVGLGPLAPVDDWNVLMFKAARLHRRGEGWIVTIPMSDGAEVVALYKPTEINLDD